MKYLDTCVAILFSLVCLNCRNAAAGAVNKALPANLSINFIASTDGSGLVSFTATANNAVNYLYDFGNGDTKRVPSGIISYQYTLTGTNRFTVTVTATSASGQSIKKSTPVTVTIISAKRALFWSEEFNKDGAPDSTKWGYDLGAGGWGNAELEYYTSRPENAIVQGGVLKINAIKENYKGSPYTSARLLSKGKFEFTYGRVEVKAKLPEGVGTWPAIWMLGSDANTVGWPACGEIDIMEHLGRQLNTIYGTLHYPGRSGGNADGGTRVISNATTAFHIYALDWTAAAIKIYVDDQLVHTVANSKNLPFNHDFFLILNMAVGGNFGGAVDPAFTRATMEIDYVRVYK